MDILAGYFIKYTDRLAYIELKEESTNKALVIEINKFNNSGGLCLK